MVVAGLVLVVDDNAGFRSLAARILTSWGHDVVEAGTVSEALSRMTEHEPRVVLVDIGLPDGNGFDLARELLHLAPAVPVVIMSTDSDAGNESGARRAGAAAFFPKDELTSPALKQLLEDA
jgi:CheY-like chemotaxis protein